MSVAGTASEILEDGDLSHNDYLGHDKATKALFKYFTKFPEKHSYDIVHRNRDYYFTAENTDYSRDDYLRHEPEDLIGHNKGEYDILLLDVDDREAFYLEVKSSEKGKSDGADQIDRAERTFNELSDSYDSFDWNIGGVAVASNEIFLPRTCFENLDETGSTEYLSESAYNEDYRELKKLLMDKEKILGKRE